MSTDISIPDRSQPGGSEFPRAFGGYLLLAPLGKGGMGEVFLAKTLGEGGMCVVKKLRADLNEDREYTTRFVDEAMVVVQLDHPNICKVFDVGTVGRGEMFLAMEFISGVDAKALTDRAVERQTSLPIPAAVQVGIDVMAALDHAHKRSHPRTGLPLELVHRDVSPHNIVIGFNGGVKLIDFGLAASTLKIEKTAPNVVMGKMAYMGPEQARGDEVDARADQFAAAMVIYEMLVGERFYAGLTPNQIWNTVGRGGFFPRRWKDLDKALRNVLGKALHKDRRKRFKDCAQARAALVEYLHTHHAEAGDVMLRETVAELMDTELNAAWALRSRLDAISVMDYSADLERSGQMASSFAQAHTDAKLQALKEPTRVGLPPPRAATAREPTAVSLPVPRPVSGVGPDPLAAVPDRRSSGKSQKAPATEIVRDRSMSGSGATPVDSILASARGHSSQEAEETEYVQRGRRGPEHTEVVREPATGGRASTSGAHVQLVHPSEAMASAPTSKNPVIWAFAAAGGLALVLVGVVLAKSMTPSTAGPTGTAVALVEPSPSPPPDPAPADPGEELQGSDAKADPEPQQVADPNEPADSVDDRADRRPQGSRRTTSGRAADRTPEPRDRASPPPSSTSTSDDAARKAREKEAAAAALAAKQELARQDANRKLMRGRQLMGKKGYDGPDGWPSPARSAYQKAQADEGDVKLASAFLDAAERAPKRPAPASEAKPKTRGGKRSAKVSTSSNATLYRAISRSGCTAPCRKPLGARLASYERMDATKKASFRRELEACHRICVK